MKNPERMATDGVNIWVFHCEGPGPAGDGCPNFREDVAPTQNQAELDALRGRWEIVEGHWHCPRCVRKVDDALYGVETRLEPESTPRPSQENHRQPQGLTAITIENFKGIGQAVTIPLRPVTLLFGANSAGKSTIIQALQYAWEILENRNADVDRTRLGGEVIDLGGFQNLVHGHDTANHIRIRIEFAVDADGLPSYREWPSIDVNKEYKVETAWVEVVSGTTDDSRQVQILSYRAGINGEFIAGLCPGPNAEPKIEGINLLHPAIQNMDESAQEAIAQYELLAEVESSEYKIDAPFRSSVIPEFGRSFHWPDEYGSSVESLVYDTWHQLFDQVLTRTGEILLKQLNGLRYLGPLRAVPERTYASPRRPDATRWANGLAAWDALLRTPPSNDGSAGIVDQCNHYLNDVLGLGYTVRRDSRIQLPDDSAILSEMRLFAAQYDERDGAEFRRRVLEPLERLPRIAALQLHDEKRDIDIEPMDIGVGVSQTLPVVVGAVEPNCTIFAVEQPELHIHPAVQSRMGDLFLRECLGTPGRIFLLETHSEHLMLRMLRRIRETADGELPPGYPRVTPEDVQVLYVESEGGVTSIVPLPITEDGDFAQKWPHGFFTEREEDLF